MALGIDQLSLCEVTLMATPVPILPCLTSPPDNSFIATAIATAIATDELTTPIETVGPLPHTDFPIKVAILPNKGRSYVATRTIQPQELVFVAEAFGTTMCDPWLDCGVCHYCWMTIENRKTQVRLPRSEPDLEDKEKEKKKDSSKKRKLETVMVFCDETCLQMYGSEMAQMICRVEHKIRRTWNESGSSHWKIRSSTSTAQSSGPAISISSAATTVVHTSSASVTVHYSTLIQQALSLANTSLAVLELSDQELGRFLDNVWGALDGLIGEQESFLLDQISSSTAIKDHKNVQDQKQEQQQHHRQQYTQKDIEAFYPTLATYLLEGNNFATIAPRMSDDDCETARLISEVLYRRQLDIKDQGTSLPSPLLPVSGSAARRASQQQQPEIQGERATFADYCAMQSNELVLLRQQLNLDISERDQEENVPEDRDQVCSPRSTATEDNDHHHHHRHHHHHHHSMKAWRRLISILPDHLLGCFYIYLRLRDAYLLLAQEEEREENNSPITLSIDNNLFRTILYAEVANSFGIRDASDELLGFAVFPRACFFNHSCRPNIEKKRRQGGKARQMEYWSTCVIEQGEECCISYGDISKGRAERMSRLEDMYFFRCSCVRCIEEEEEIQAEKRQ
ncbi:hypothetical protein BGZ80_008531 [Entomortierella chlamydospora]|uniref:SET domain-containing protein n=1 Tax=Entomortierella chlamydospora TaxID=101097 RepID=A0A9P6MXU9_9FUNG|nr:hypothetical protein BGZ80_008531 [Entomortierella chlamydospora]